MLRREEIAKGAAYDRIRLNNLNKNLEALRNEYKELLVELKLHNPDYANLVTASPLNLSKVQAILEPSVTLIEYVVTDDQTIVFIITHDDFQTVTLNVARADLKQAIERSRYFTNLENPHPYQLEWLYNQIFKPLESYIHNEILGILPHGVLHDLSFAALTDGKHHLIDKYTLFYLPSASILPVLLKKKNSLGRGNMLMAMGVPQARGFLIWAM